MIEFKANNSYWIYYKGYLIEHICKGQTVTINDYSKFKIISIEEKRYQDYIIRITEV